MNNNIIKTSKFLSLVLRHKPETIGLSLDANGWADIDTLVTLTQSRSNRLTRELIEEVVVRNDKQRFVISDDGRRIRANQGHSIVVNLDLQPQQPPNVLYHGTATRFLDSIKAQGLQKRQRQHVHLSADLDTASKVGVRHGKLVILKIEAEKMLAEGYTFYLSANEVWLTDYVPPQYISELL